MRAYIVTSGIIFALITVAHFVRILFENPRLARDPVFVLLTVLTIVMTVWAWKVLPPKKK
ncbi:MAG: hypothetical protein R3C19_11250 [Planctomycetaceae bacterium]